MARSKQLGLLKLIEQVGFLTIFFALIPKRNYERHGSDSSTLKSPTSMHLS